MKKLNIGIVGLGRLGRDYANNIQYKVIEPKRKEFVIKSYADNFLKN